MRLTITFLTCIALAAVGCGQASDGPPMYDVEGTVTFDGQPVEKGRILFRQMEGDQKAYSAEVQNGKYELESPEGAARVEIVASRIIPGKFDHSNGVPEPVGEMYIPKQYNKQTELEAHVSPEGDNQFDFDLKPK